MGSPGNYSKPVFLKNGPPLASAPRPGGNTIANQALRGKAGSSGMGLGQSFSLMNRYTGSTVASNVVNTGRSGASALRPAQAAAQVAARRTATQILMSKPSLSGAREIAARALQPAVRASGAVAGAIARTPVIGPSLRFVSRFVPKGPALGVLTAVTVIPDLLELFAPGVKSWLLGGWRGFGQGSPTAGGIILDGDPTAIYTVELWATSVSPYDGGVKSVGTFLVFNHVYGLKSANLLSSGEYYGVSYTATGSGEESQFAGTSVKKQFWENAYLRFKKNGVYLTDQPGVVRPPLTTENLAKTNPSQSQTATHAAFSARNAALAAAAVTIAAGKYKPAPVVNKNPTRNPERKVGVLPSASPTTPQPSSTPCKGNSCGQAGLDQSVKNGEDIQKILDALSLLGIGEIRSTVKRIDEKVGPQLYDDRGQKTGLAGAALKTFEKLNKVGDYLHFDRITNVMTLAVTVHNAAMLSNQLEQTLMSAISNGLAAIGIKDSENNPLDINKIVGQSVENMVKGAIGAENYAALTTNWKKANRIYQASANLLNNLQSLRYSITGALETIGGMNAKVGNALKKYGVLGDNAYPWFNPSPDYDNKFMRGLEVAETTVSTIDSVASEILSAQDSVKQIGEQKTELEKAVKEGLEKPGVDNDQQKAKALAAKTASVSPDINAVDLVKPGGI